MKWPTTEEGKKFTENCLRIGLLAAMRILIQYKEGEESMPETIEKDSDVVYPGAECPQCGENRVDYLANDEGKVTCATCGCVYDIS